MNWFEVQEAPPEEWAKLAENAHLVGFGEKRPADMNRYAKVIVAVADAGLLGYIGVIEHGSRIGHMQHGAAMPLIRGKGRTREVYDAMMDFLKNQYDVLTAMVKNDNLKMIALHHGHDLRIIGCNLYIDGVYLHMRWERVH